VPLASLGANGFFPEDGDIIFGRETEDAFRFLIQELSLRAVSEDEEDFTLRGSLAKSISKPSRKTSAASDQETTNGTPPAPAFNAGRSWRL